MALILNIETSTKNCSVSIAKEGNLVHYKEINDGNYSHAEKLHPFIMEVLSEAKIDKSSIDAIAVSKGPGSYTGLRIGVSAAKGLCFALNIPLISIDTLKSLATSTKVDDGYIIPMLDARRMEVYAAIFDSDYNQVREVKAEIIDETSFEEFQGSNLLLLGDGSAKCKGVLNSANITYLDDKFPSSKEMAFLSYEKYKKNDIEDVAYFEPFYLKDFIVTPQKKKV